MSAGPFVPSGRIPGEYLAVGRWSVRIDREPAGLKLVMLTKESAYALELTGATRAELEALADLLRQAAAGEP